MNDFEQFVEGLVEMRFRTAGALAAAVGMTLSAFSRGVRSGTLSVENCLKLAEVSGEPPSRLLQIAGKGEVADLIERLYGKSTVAPAERKLLDKWASLAPAVREHLMAVIDIAVSEQKQSEAAKRRKSA